MPKPPSLSDKEAALITAARRELAARQPQPAPGATASKASPDIVPAGIAPAASAAASRSAGTAAGHKLPRAAAVAAAPAAASAIRPALSMDERFAALVLAEQQEKERRKEAYRRWLMGGAIFLVALLLWFALSVMGTLRR